MENSVMTKGQARATGGYIRLERAVLRRLLTMPSDEVKMYCYLRSRLQDREGESVRDPHWKIGNALGWRDRDGRQARNALRGLERAGLVESAIRAGGVISYTLASAA